MEKVQVEVKLRCTNTAQWPTPGANAASYIPLNQPTRQGQLLCLDSITQGVQETLAALARHLSPFTQTPWPSEPGLERNQHPTWD